MRAPLSRSSTNTFYILDLDRHLVDTIKLNRLLEDTIAKTTTIPLSVMRKARDEVEASGGSFDTATYIQPILAEIDYPLERLMKDFIHSARRQDVFELGAPELLAMIRSAGLPFGIVTYGGDIWQEAKLQATRLDNVPYVITPHKAKGKLIQSWQQPNGTFILPRELSHEVSHAMERIFLLDDKASSFDGLPPEAYGLHVLPSDKPALAVQLGTVGPNVTVVSGLFEAADHIRDYIST